MYERGLFNQTTKDSCASFVNKTFVLTTQIRWIISIRIRDGTINRTHIVMCASPERSDFHSGSANTPNRRQSYDFIPFSQTVKR